MNKAVIYKKASKDEWYTPKHIVDYFGKFDLDVASSEYNSKRLGIKKYFSKENTALDKDWKGKVWCNPPFSIKNDFIKKAREEVDKGNADVYILLPMSFEIQSFHKYILGGGGTYIYLIKELPSRPKVKQKAKLPLSEVA